LHGTSKCHLKENPMETTNESTKQETTTNPRRWGRRGLWALLIVPVLLTAGICGARAYADEAFGLGHGMGGNPEQHKAFMEKRLDKMLDNVKATDSQRTAIKAIFERMFTEMQPVHQQHKALHDQIAAAFTAPTVDRAAVENLRKQIPTLVDQASQVFTKALLDASQVLTPEQRQTLVKTMQEHHGRPHRFM
jgi:Spy/CpxP family protein refolding chaperone